MMVGHIYRICFVIIYFALGSILVRFGSVQWGFCHHETASKAATTHTQIYMVIFHSKVTVTLNKHSELFLNQ